LSPPPLDRAALRGATRLLILQGTPFCNVDCTYCYLPGRDRRERMAHATVAAAVRWVFEADLAPDPLCIAWHAGEPLVLPPDWYRGAIAAARGAAPPGAALRHFVQTNATLVNDAWCDLFREHGIEVGVSLDGPAAIHDRRRRTRAGGGTHAAALRGMRLLRARGLDPHAICVLGEASLDHPEAIVAFFAAEGVRDVGFNGEEQEGVHAGSTLARPGIEGRFRRFLERALDAAHREGIAIRELRDQAGMLLALPGGLSGGNSQNLPFSNVTVAHDGAIHTFSPELAGVAHPRLGHLALGHVERDTLEGVLASPLFRAAWAEVAEGVALCARSCSYFPLCGGGAPSNKLAERGTFAAGETLSCRLIPQQVAEAVLGRLLPPAAAG
jgi:uncharacterized protein